MRYRIHYTHTGPATAATMAAARDEIRDEAMRVAGRTTARAEVVFVPTEDGIYAYTSQADADADDDGTRALAVIVKFD